MNFDGAHARLVPVVLVVASQAYAARTRSVHSKPDGKTDEHWPDGRPVGLSCAGASPKQKKKWRSDEALPRQQLDCAQQVRQPIVATVKRHWHHT